MFLNPLMLAGLGAAVIPLVLHLLSKARYRPVEWGAMMFLESSPAHQQRTAKVKQMILLLLRMSIIAGLALGMARPTFRKMAAAPGDSDQNHIHAIVILDCSASMGFETNGRSRLDIARQALVNILSNLHRGDEISLILMGDGNESADVQPTTDLQSIASRIGSLTPLSGRARIDQALDRARQILLRNPSAHQEVYLVCDHQANSWEAVNDTIAQTWQKAQHSLLSPAKFFVIPIGGDESDNVAVESIELPGPPPVRDIDCDVLVTLRNYGDLPRSNLPLTQYVEDRAQSHTLVNLPANSTMTVRLSMKFPSSGSHILSAHVESNGMRSDDQLDRAIDVLEPIRVLLVRGDQSIRPSGEPDYLQLALSPHQSAGQTGPDPAIVRTVGDDDWWGLSPDRDDVVLLDNISQLSNDRVRELEQFVYGGGGLIIAPGDLTDPDSYNADFYRDGEGFLPASLATSATSAASDIRIKQAEMTHPIFDFLHGATHTLSEPLIRRSLTVDEMGPDTHVLATLSNNQPLLIERTYGAGRVLMLTTSVDTAWTSLPTTEFYLPFIQSITRYAAGATLPDRNLHPGEPIELTFDHQPTTSTATITLPDHQQRSVPIIQSGSQWSLQFWDTSEPGRYVLTLGASQSPLNYVVLANHDESDLTPLSPQRWAWLQKSLDFRRVEPDRSAISAAIIAMRSGGEAYVPIIALVIGLAVCEMTIARWWSQQR